jgi:hypothetical protein
MARNPISGDLFVVWTEQEPAQFAEILSRQWKQTDNTWTPVENLSNSPWEDRAAHLFFSCQGQGVLLWTRRYAAYQGAPADGTDLLWRSWRGTDWSPEQVLIHNDFVLPGSYGLIPVETPNSILLFVTWSNAYRTTEYQGGAWSELSPWQYLSYQSPDVNPELTQIVRDDMGRLHAAAFGENSSQNAWDQYFNDAYYLSYDNGTWSVPLNLSYKTGVADHVGLAFDSQKRLHFLWSDPDSQFSSESDLSAIWERVYEGGVWTANHQVTAYHPSQAISDFSLATDVSGTLNLTWSEGIIEGYGHTDLDIYYQESDGTAWGPEQKVYTSTADSRFPSLAFTADGPAIAWQEGTSPTLDVYFSRSSNATHSYRLYLPLVLR